MISYAMLVFAIMMKGTVQLHVECFLNETLTVQNPNETRFKFFDISSDTDNANCMGEFSDDFLHLFLRNCKLDKQIEVLFRSDNSGILKKENIAGPYRFLCKNIPIGGIIFHVGVGLIVSENSSLPTLIREVDGSLIVTQLGGGVSKQTANVVGSQTKVEWLFDAPEIFMEHLDSGSKQSYEKDAGSYSVEGNSVPTVPNVDIVTNAKLRTDNEFNKINDATTETTREMTTSNTERSRLENMESLSRPNPVGMTTRINKQNIGDSEDERVSEAERAKASKEASTVYQHAMNSEPNTAANVKGTDGAMNKPIPIDPIVSYENTKSTVDQGRQTISDFGAELNTEGFTARPETCTSESQLFLSRGCSEKHGTITNFEQTEFGHKSRYSVILFTNKFSGSGSTTVVCSMRLCPSQSAKNCELNCDGRRRRRFVAKRRSTGVIYETAILRVEFKDRPSKENVESNSSFKGCDLTCVLLSFLYIILKTT